MLEKLKAFLGDLDKTKREELARSCSTSVGHLKNVMYGYKPCHPKLAAALERESARLVGHHRMVYRWDLIPLEWREIWPELGCHPSAPRRIAETEKTVTGDNRGFVMT